MASERAPGQKLIPIPASAGFIKELNAGFKKAGYDNRSQFIRDAILEKLARKGIKIPESLALAPDRLGKGGKSLVSYPPLDRAGGFKLNELSSKGAAALGRDFVEEKLSAAERSAAAKLPSGKARRKAKAVPPPATPET